MTTILDSLDSGTQWLEKKGIVDARHHMQLMLCHVLDCSKIQLYTNFEQVLDESQLTALRSMLKRRGSREPLQHILGTVEFYRREFFTDARALIPRPETEELVELCLHTLKLPRPLRILDVGTGSGVIGISLALELGAAAEVICSDLSPAALELAEKNAQALKAENVTFVQSHLFEHIDGDFDLIVANLPYVPEVDRQHLEPELAFDPDLALFSGHDGLDIIRDFIQKCSPFLRSSGQVILEIGINQHTQVEQALSQAGFSEIVTHSDLSSIKRFPSAIKP